jgi:hypothetical protein
MSVQFLMPRQVYTEQQIRPTCYHLLEPKQKHLLRRKACDLAQPISFFGPLQHIVLGSKDDGVRPRECVLNSQLLETKQKHKPPLESLRLWLTYKLLLAPL